MFHSDPQANEAGILRYLEDHILETVSPASDTAAIIVEAIQSDGGVIAPSADFFRGLEAIARRHSILLVFDEVKVGLGRTGDWFAFQFAGVTPDFVVLGKSLGGGLPLSAVVGRRDLLDSEAAVALIMTLSGNALSCAAGAAVLEAIQAEQLMDNAISMGARLRRGLEELRSRHDLIGDIRGRGLALGMELVTNQEEKTSASREAAKVCFRAAELGLLVFYFGLKSNVLEFTPPLSIRDSDVDRGLEILDAALADVTAGRVADEDVAAYARW
jgi:4-aminobutyrate aminotransferase